MIQTTRWSPDTCSCVIEYQWDDSVDSASRVHTASRIVTQCANHAGQNLSTHFAALSEENPRKNKILDAIVTQFPALVLDDISWSFDASRVITITCPKLTAGQKATLQTIGNSRFPGKVVIS